MNHNEEWQVDEIMSKVSSAAELLRTIHGGMDGTSGELDAIWGVANYLDYIVEEMNTLLTPKEQ